MPLLSQALDETVVHSSDGWMDAACAAIGDRAAHTPTTAAMSPDLIDDLP